MDTRRDFLRAAALFSLWLCLPNTKTQSLSYKAGDSIDFVLKNKLYPSFSIPGITEEGSQAIKYF